MPSNPSPINIHFSTFSPLKIFLRKATLCPVIFTFNLSGYYTAKEFTATNKLFIPEDEEDVESDGNPGDSEDEGDGYGYEIEGEEEREKQFGDEGDDMYEPKVWLL